MSIGLRVISLQQHMHTLDMLQVFQQPVPRLQMKERNSDCKMCPQLYSLYGAVVF